MKKILIVADESYRTSKMFFYQVPKLAKGFIRLGNDVRCFPYNHIVRRMSPVKSKKISKFLYKNKADNVLLDFTRHYMPDIILFGFPKFFDLNSIRKLRDVAPNAVFVGDDGDPWIRLNPQKINMAKEFDILVATNDGQWLQDYRDAGVPFCSFMSNCCDPDIDHRYKVEDKWRSDLLWIGVLEHSADTSYTFRKELITELAKKDNAKLYGCLGYPKISGIDVLYAISGARIGVSINAYEGVHFAHSDRLTRFLASGTFVLSKRFPGCEFLYKDGEHLRYFNTIEEFFELAQWYLSHERERKEIADAGMKWVHEQFNGTKVAGYILELVEKGRYSAPWFEHLSTAQLGR